MFANPILDQTRLDFQSHALEHAPFPMAVLEGAMHIVRDLNPAFRRLINHTSDELVGRPFRELAPDQAEFLALLDDVYRTGESATRSEQEDGAPHSAFSAYSIWPVTVDDRTLGVMIQLKETASVLELTRAMNEALLLGSLRQHELRAAAELATIELQSVIGQLEQSERDALALTKEISHRIKNNLQVILGLVDNEIKRTSAEHAQGYVTLKGRIGAISELYALISQSSGGDSVTLDAYLGEVARIMSASLIEPSSGIRIEVIGEAVRIDPDRAVLVGLLVNELITNAIKHAFPGGAGRVLLTVEEVLDQIELTVADNGVGLGDKKTSAAPGRHGSEYVQIFVRQLGGTITVSGSDGTGTVVRIRFPLLLVGQS